MGSALFKRGKQKLSSKNKPSSFFDFKVKDINGQEFDFATLKGKKAIMVVNVACKCVLTNSNYTEMVNMYDELRDKGLEILAFPCNQFFSQQNGSPAQIKAFVEETFKAKFLIMQKVEVNGDKTHPLYVYLREHSELYDPKTKQSTYIPWNFAKFIINQKGDVTHFFKPSKEIDDVRKAIQIML